MSIIGFVVVLFIPFILFFFVKYFDASLPVPFNQVVGWIAAALLIIFLIYAVVSMLGWGGGLGALNEPMRGVGRR
jgi:quinol-cytochrome oxidoreductase complex cytochrome b subunit